MNSEGSYNPRDNYYKKNIEIPKPKSTEEAIKKTETVEKGIKLNHDYSDQYYLKDNNQNPHDDFPVKQNLLNLEEQPLDSTNAKVLRKATPVGGITAKRNLPEGWVFEDPFEAESSGEPSATEQAEIILSTKRIDLNVIDTLYEAVTKSIGFKYNKDHLPKLNQLLEEIPINDFPRKAKVISMIYGRAKISDKIARTDFVGTIRSDLIRILKRGTKEDYKMLTALLNLDNTLANSLYRGLITDIRAPIEDVQSGSAFYKSCLSFWEMKLQWFSENKHFKEIDKVGFKGLNNFNFMFNAIVSSLNDKDLINQDLISEIHSNLETNLAIYQILSEYLTIQWIMKVSSHYLKQ